MNTIERTATRQSDTSALDLGAGQFLTLDPRENLVGGLAIEPKLTLERHPYDISWERRDIRIINFKTQEPTFERLKVEVPSHWGESAARITVSKYLFGSDPETPQYEDSLKHAFDRIANTYTLWGWKHGYFAAAEDARNFNWELKFLLVNQLWAPNSPVWFNIGHWEQWRWGRPDLRPHMKARGNQAFKARLPNDCDISQLDPDEAANALELLPVDNPYTHPQASACFLLGVEDSMDSILKNQIAEGGVFSSGSGVGMNLSSIRSSSEPISGRGIATGPISFDAGWDTMAGAIKSGGKTRRAARMVLLFSDHPDIFDFIHAKNDQEDIGKIILREHNVHLKLREIASIKQVEGAPAERIASKFILNVPLSNEIEYDNGMDDLLYGRTLRHQNANHSISLKGDFWKAFHSKGEYSTRRVTDPNYVCETFAAEKLLDEMAKSVWHNAEPGSHNNDFINLWNPVKADGDILTSNPCSEYLHLNFTSCNLSSFNLYHFLKDDHTLDIEKFKHATRLAMIAADLNIEEGGFPIPKIARGTYLYRTTGIGYTNLGGVLMSLGIPYDSDEGRLIASQITSLLTATCWEASAEMGAELGAYPRYEATKKDLKEILELHKASQTLAREVSQGNASKTARRADQIFKKRSSRLPQAQGLTGRDALKGFLESFGQIDGIRRNAIVDQLLDENETAWEGVTQAKKFRNSFVSCLAPTGTISGAMGVYDLGTTSAEPDYTLVKYKNLSGGGMLKLFNGLALDGLKTLGYSEWQVREAAFEVAGLDGLFTACNTSTIETAKHLFQKAPKDLAGPIRQTFTKLAQGQLADMGKIEKLVIDLHAKGQDFTALGDEQAILNGEGHMQNIPWLAPEHLPVFDCSAASGSGSRSITPKGHMRMLGAIQPFISGATSKTTNLPSEATIDDIKQCFIDCHKMGVKCVAIFRADSKGISVYNVDTPEGRKWNPDNIWRHLVDSVKDEAKQIMAEASRPKRIKLPGRRASQTLKFHVNGGQLDGFLTFGIYPDGKCGEVFGCVGQGGSFVNGMFEAFCKLFSTSLQFRLPLDQLIESFRYTAFDPSGFCQIGDTEGTVQGIKTCKSIIDLMMQVLEWLFPKDNDFRIRDTPEHNSFSSPDGTIELVPAQDITENNGNGRARIELPKAFSNNSVQACPQCGSLAYLHDGKCRSCRDCGYKDGGCGE